MSFTIALSTAALMLAYAIPGYVMTRLGKIRAEAISAFAAMLVMACAPFQTLEAIQRIDCTPYNTQHIFIQMAITFATMIGMLALSYVVLRRKQGEARYRICTIATTFGNTGFMGIPLLEALLPQYPQAVAFAAASFIAMNMLMWSVASAIITRDKKYISLRKVFLNPSSIGMFVGMALYFAHIKLTGGVSTFVTGLSKMCTPLCMLILGMRLGCAKLRAIFTSPLQYAAVAVKLLVFPLLTLAICSLLPLERDFVRGIYVISCVPVANMVLSFSEMLGEGQEYAANVVLLSTMLSVVTMPLMLMLV